MQEGRSVRYVVRVLKEIRVANQRDSLLFLGVRKSKDKDMGKQQRIITHGQVSSAGIETPFNVLLLKNNEKNSSTFFKIYFLKIAKINCMKK